VHRTFLEYFCACEFVERFGKRGLEGSLTLEELKTEVFGKHWQDESWHEVLRLIVGMIDTSFAGEIIDYLMALDGEEEKFINLFLAAECLLEVRNRKAIKSTDIQLLKNLKSLTKYDLNYDDEPDVDEVNLVWKIHIQSVSAVATIWKDDPDTLPWLKQRATNDDLWDVRMFAALELVKGWKDDPDTLPILKQRATNDDELDVRSAAVEELANGWKDDPDTLPILKQRATNDNEPFVRSTAVEELANGWKDEPWMFEFLYNCALNDPFERVIDSWEFSPRQIALNLIIKQYPNHPQTLPLLQDRAENDPDKEVREFANKKLAELEEEPNLKNYEQH
jgi:predicted NACHT family NTPase